MKPSAPIIDGADRGAAGTSARPPHERFDDELVMDLERDQFVAETSQPVPRAELSRRATIALWALRVFVVVVSLMVVYTFFYQLR